MHLIMVLLFGLIVGLVAHWIVPGRSPGGWGASMLLGTGGAMLGAVAGGLVGLYRAGQPAGFIMAVLGAMALVGIYHALRPRFA
jgi:uncharacterized membrane protein YeaQ/YmgE (transglycosylase-associated protein family)